MSGREKLLSSNNKPRGLKLLPDENVSQQRSRKIMLVDLCPEEKAKIGELMITLQEQKTRNEELEAALKEEIANRQHNEHLIEKLKQEIEVLRIELESNVQMVATLDRQLQLRRQASDRLAEELKCKHPRKSPTKAIGLGCQTYIEVSNREAQTVSDCCNRATQTLSLQQFYHVSRNNTSSAKSSMSLTPMATFPPYDRTLQDQVSKKGSSKGLPPLPPLSRNNDPMTYSELNEEKREADASELAQAWLEMKKWSIQKMKKDIKKSKKKANHTSMDDSRSSDEGSNSSRLEPGNERRLLLAIHRLSREKEPQQQVGQEQHEPPQTVIKKHDTELDEDALNTMLKSNDFRASRLVKSTSRSNHNDSQQKKSYGMQFYDPELLDLINDLN